MKQIEREARDRILDWALAEQLGGIRAAAGGAVGARRSGGVAPLMDADVGGADPVLAADRRTMWRTAAAVVFGVGVLGAVAWVSSHTWTGDDGAPVQDPDVAWTHDFAVVASVEQVLALPEDTRAVRTLSFDDDEVAALGRLTRLEALDLGGMVMRGGALVSPSLTDGALEAVARFKTLRWLGLSGCHHIDGGGLAALEALPALERLDLQGCHIDEAGLRALGGLRALRHLDLSFNMGFPSSALELVGRLEGLEWLSLARCHQLVGTDFKHLKALTRLVHLDLSGCDGHFRGSTSGDGIYRGDRRGLTDEGLGALAGLNRLRHLSLGGCPALSAVGVGLLEDLALVSLDLTGLTLDRSWVEGIPETLEALELPQTDWGQGAAELGPLLKLLRTRLTGLRELGLGAVAGLTDDHVGGLREMRLRRVDLSNCPELTAAAIEALATAPGLRELDLSKNPWVDDDALAALAKAPTLQALVLDRCEQITDAGLEHLRNLPLRQLHLNWCQEITWKGLERLAHTPLEDLAILRTGVTGDVYERAQELWPGAKVRLPDGRTSPQGR